MLKLLLFFLVSAALAAYYEDTYEATRKVLEGQELRWQYSKYAWFRGMSQKQQNMFFETRLNRRRQLPVKKVVSHVKLPENFDAREKWKMCKWMPVIRDQANCGSCWAVSAASTMSDRLCTFSNGTVQPYVSDENLLSCCRPQCGDGCNGGDPFESFVYWMETGLVTGGPYGYKNGCQPYSIHCDRCNGSAPTPPCLKKCIPEYPKFYEKDKSYGVEAYFLEGVQNIMVDIYENGPVSAAFIVFDDFLEYKEGVYEYRSGSFAGLHAVKIIGWGVEKDQGNIPYWLVANSWDDSWGMKGLFKIRRGTDECAIESDVCAPSPLSLYVFNRKKY